MTRSSLSLNSRPRHMPDVDPDEQRVTLSAIESLSPPVKAWLPEATSIGSLTLDAQATSTSSGRHPHREPRASEETLNIGQANSSGVQTT